MFNQIIGGKELEIGEMQKELSSYNTQSNRRLLEVETKNMKNIATLNEDVNDRLNSLQDQISKYFPIFIPNYFS